MARQSRHGGRVRAIYRRFRLETFDRMLSAGGIRPKLCRVIVFVVPFPTAVGPNTPRHGSLPRKPRSGQNWRSLPDAFK
jgi:hypothetical protein